MGKIIYLEGSRAVGKSTLLNKIKSYNPDYIIMDGYSRKEFDFDLTKYDEFLINEMLYLSCDITQYRIMKSVDKNFIVVKGPLTDVFFAQKMFSINFSKEISVELDDLIKSASRCVPDEIIYLDADVSVIMERYINDKKNRVTMDEFLKNWLSDFREYYISMEKTKIINTNSLNPNEVYSEFMSLIK